MARRAGQIIQRGDRTFVERVFLGRDRAGKKQYFDQTIQGTQKDAERALNKLLVKNDAGQLHKANPQTQNDYLEHWVNSTGRRNTLCLEGF